MSEATKPVFREVQQFRQPWVWVLVVFAASTSWYAVLQQLVCNVPFGNNPAPDAALVLLWAVFGVAFPAAFYQVKLETEVVSDGIRIRFFPFHLSYRTIPLDQLVGCESQTYRPIRDYGGWGIRCGPGGKAYNVSGNRGVQLRLADGKSILIGSQKSEELCDVIALALARRDSRQH